MQSSCDVLYCRLWPVWLYHIFSTLSHKQHDLRKKKVIGRKIYVIFPEQLYVNLFQITNLMHNSFILQQYVCYITILNMFRAAHCLSSGGQILSPQPLVSSPSVSSRTVCRWRADCSPLSTCILYGCLWRVTIPEAVVIQLVLLRMSSVLLETCWGA